MPRKEVRRVLTASPFRPLRIHLGDGGALEVPHPDFAALHPAGRTLVLLGTMHDYSPFC